MYTKPFLSSISVLALVFTLLLLPAVTAHGATEPKLTGTISWDLLLKGDGCDDSGCVNGEAKYTGTLNLSLHKDYRGIWVDDGSSTVTASYDRVSSQTLSVNNPYYTPTCANESFTSHTSVINQSFNQILGKYLTVSAYNPYVRYEWALLSVPTDTAKAFLKLVPFEAPLGSITFSPSTCVFSDQKLDPLGVQPRGIIPDDSLPYGVGFAGAITAGTLPGNPTINFDKTIYQSRMVGSIVNTYSGTITGTLKLEEDIQAGFTATTTGVDKEVRFDASSSHVSSGNAIAQYQWDFGDGTTLATVSTPTNHLFPEHDKDYTVKLVITDNKGNQSDPLSIIVHSPKIQPEADFTFLVHPGGKVEFDARGSTSAPGGKPVVLYTWNFGDESPETTIADSTKDHLYDYLSQPLPLKKYKATLTVIDGNGNTSDPVEREIDVCTPDFTATNGHEYAGLVRCVEARMPDKTPRQVLGIMRKIYYGNEDWSITKSPIWDDVITCGLDELNPKSILNAKLYAQLTTSRSTIPNLDISHIFPGLEAMECPTRTVTITHPSTNVPQLPVSVWEVKMPNYSFATWGGDLGSAAGQRVTDMINNTASERDWSAYFETPGTLSSAEDLNGDIDGLVLGYYLSGRSCSVDPAPTNWMVPVSKAIADYYPDPNETSISDAYQNRIQCFTQMLGAKDAKQKGDAVKTHTFKDEVYEVALPWYIQRVDKTNGAGILGPVILLKTNSDQVTDLFGDWLNRQ